MEGEADGPQVCVGQMAKYPVVVALVGGHMLVLVMAIGVLRVMWCV